MESPSISQVSRTTDSSDKTDTSKSGDILPERDMDLSKDNAASPIDLECHIQAERIGKILEKTIARAKNAVAISHIICEHFFLVKGIMPEDHFEDMMFIFEQYDNPLFSQSLVNLEAVENLKNGDLSLRNRLNPELGHLVYMLDGCRALKPLVDKVVAKMRKEYANETILKKPKKFIEFLYTLEHFRDIMLKRMETTAAEELAAKITKRKLEKSNNDLIAKINDVRKTIHAEQEVFESSISSKNSQIAELRQELMLLDNLAQARLMKQVVDSDREMVMAYRAHTLKNEMLKEEETDSKDSYNNLLNRSLMDEKNQRQRRLKVETQLLSWIQKYDIEMSEKQKELDEFIDKYKDEEERVEQLEKDLEKQDQEYIPLMKEREEEYHQEMTEKMNMFLIEHAARVIQTAWKQVLRNRAEKKKLRKAVQKMKEAAEKQRLKEEAEARKAAKIAKREAQRAAKAAKEEKLRKAKEEALAKAAAAEAAKKAREA